jgi:hypothetical protein
LEKKYRRKFAEEEAKAFDNEQAYDLVQTGWTSIYVYIPITTSTYTVTPNFQSNFEDKELYPWQVSLTHTRIYESTKFGRFFVKFGGSLQGTNNIKAEELDGTSIEQYKNLGGIDTITLAKIDENTVYVGEYKNFTSPKMQLQLVYFPKKWNIGLSAYAESFFGSYNPTNLKLGIPIRLNDKDGDPTVTFELQARFADIQNKIGQKDNSFGISVGLPFSSILN